MSELRRTTTVQGRLDGNFDAIEVLDGDPPDWNALLAAIDEDPEHRLTGWAAKVRRLRGRPDPELKKYLCQHGWIPGACEECKQ